jgi:hypothetical protein
VGGDRCVEQGRILLEELGCSIDLIPDSANLPLHIVLPLLDSNILTNANNADQDYRGQHDR